MEYMEQLSSQQTVSVYNVYLWCKEALANVYTP